MKKPAKKRTQGAGAAREVDYDLRGDFLEVCDCFTVCPCWTDRPPDGETCTGVFAWSISKGKIENVDVSGETVVSVSTHEGHRDVAKQRVVLFVSEHASQAQVDVLTRAFAGLSGGPLGELGQILGELHAVERAEIEIKYATCGAQLTVGKRIFADTVNVVGSTGTVTTLADARLSTVLGTPAEVGISRRLKVKSSDPPINIDLRGRSAMRGRFEYHNRAK